MENSNPLGRRLTSLKGIGDKTEKLFGKVGIYNLDQLVHYYPRAYDSYSDCVLLTGLVPGQKQSVFVRVNNPPTIKRGGKTAVAILNIFEDGKKLEAVWFNMPYLRNVLKAGYEYVLRGMVIKKNNYLCMEQPEIFTKEAYEKIKGSIQPIYSLTAGLKSKTVAKAVGQVFDKFDFFDYLPEEIKKKYSLTDRQDALFKIHFPSDYKSLKSSRERIVFDEFLFYMLKLKRLNADICGKENKYKITDFSAADKAVSRLEFKLTNAQCRAWNEIRKDLSGTFVMNRLLQGDVGSGKTIVAFLAALSMAKQGYQSALMAPTEILAQQHYALFLRLFKDNGIGEERIVLLKGALGAAQKRLAYDKIKSGSALVVIGTHAIIQRKVEFKNLALVITDEQHRFGVNQRKSISEKGNVPHVLIMSATPIPRTLAIILYGDLRISVLDELPAGRLKIKNAVVDDSYRKTAYSFIKKEIDAGHQAYVICPMIDVNEDLGCECVIEYTAKLKKIFPKEINIAMLHGRMSDTEKTEIMAAFAENKIQILVSTTVIEVGIDVKNATVMLIENAERFGLAQLHQLRGRIGRGEFQSYCIFMQGSASDEASERLELLSRSNDGFYIAREDLKLRGQGDLFGLRQSGQAGFTLADPFTDADILKSASDAADCILSEDSSLESEKYRSLLYVLTRLESEADGVL